jgi:acyl-CoA dehydrogenase
MAADSIVAETAVRIFRDHCDPQAIIRAGGDGWKAGAWAALEDAGLPLAWVAEEFGGAGADIADGFAVLRETGRFAVALPVAETMLAGWLLAQAGISSPRGAMTCGPVRHGDLVMLGRNGTLTGRLRAIPFAKDVQHVALVAEREGGGLAVALVERSAVRVGEGASAAGDAQGPVTFERTQPVALKDAPKGFDAGSLQLIGAAVRAMQMTGALEAILDVSVGYANERVAFGRPIGKFQAVQHNLARLAGEAAAALAAAGSAADAIATLHAPTNSPSPLWGGARGGGNPDDRGSAIPPSLSLPHTGGGDACEDAIFLEVASAKIRAGEAAGEGAAIAHQVLGAIGFTREHTLHRFTQRLWAWRDDFGNESQWAVKLGNRVAANGADALWPMLAAR